MVVPDNSSSDYSKNKGFAFVCFKNSQDAEKAQNIHAEEIREFLRIPKGKGICQRKSPDALGGSVDGA